jgi:hypothetical protein
MWLAALPDVHEPGYLALMLRDRTNCVRRLESHADEPEPRYSFHSRHPIGSPPSHRDGGQTQTVTQSGNWRKSPGSDLLIYNSIPSIQDSENFCSNSDARFPSEL